jgi:hypothetical protein
VISPTAFAASQVVGVVESVSPTEVTVRLAVDAPQATALNAAHLQRFPRINGWVLIPSEAGYMIGSVTWVGVERAALPAAVSRLAKDLLDLPFPARRLKLTPLGTLRWFSRDGAQRAELIRGIASYPSVGEAALVPSPEQLRAIAQTTSSNAHVGIGTSPLAGDVDVRVDPDRLFGRHLAVLGNTGSGKSCTVAGLIRWSLQAARTSIAGASPPAPDDHESSSGPNARFIVLDSNGEYATCFTDVAGVRVFRPVTSEDFDTLTVPGWVWSSAEWAAISRASLQTQRPLLQQALRNLRNRVDIDISSTTWLAQQVRGTLDIWQSFAAVPTSYTRFPQHKSVDTSLDSILTILELARDQGQNDLVAETLSVVADVARTHLPRFDVQYPGSYTLAEVHLVVEALTALSQDLPAVTMTGAVSEDAPVPFDLDALPDHLSALAHTADFAAGAAHSSYLISRLRTMLTDARLRSIICPETGQSLADWLADLLGDEPNKAGHVAVLDLSMLASEIVQTIVAVFARVVLEALQHVRRLAGTELPTVLVLEEAHNFVGRESHAGEVPTSRDLCREAFERIAREGRKFGLGLVLSSQRPSELSQTVLSQCNTFLLHRLVNDRDQDLVGRLIPDTFGGLLRELPSLPSRHAVLLGWATPVPTLVEIHELPPLQRPRSADPEFWGTWIRDKAVDFSWSAVEERWVAPASD